MILPDDKNPTIVWDPEKKKWVNTDGDDESSDFRPPPKMSDLMPSMNSAPPSMNAPPPSSLSNIPPPSGPPSGPSSLHGLGNNQLMSGEQAVDAGSTMQSNGIPNMVDGPAKIPNLQSNMFKMQRNRSEFVRVLFILIIIICLF